MRPLPVLVGLIVLVLGLTVYYSIPNNHVVKSDSVTNPSGPLVRVIEPGVFREVVNITFGQERNPRLIVNMTVRSSDTGQLAFMDFRIADPENLDSCENGQPPYGCIYTERVSNSTMAVSLNATGAYYFIFDNQPGSTGQASVSYSYAVRGDVITNSVTLDGLPNWFGLSLGAIGALSVIYGLSRKTIIPWE